jgi:GrpB-like predicted nucleotidyltransferase (UPF0157 family)
MLCEPARASPRARVAAARTLRPMNRVQIRSADVGWAREFARIGRRLREALGELAVRVDHIGSTSVPGLPAKDVIDVQVTVPDDVGLATVPERLAGSGWTFLPEYDRDHAAPGRPAEPEEWRKALLREPSGERRANVHVRMEGRANQRYALLFRDYLRAHPDSAAAYATLKRGLADAGLPLEAYADVKDPACDLIYLAAEEWAAASDWHLGPSGA